MSILQVVKDLLEAVFMSSSPEVQKKQHLRKIDSELRSVQPVIYKNGMIQPNFAEAVHELYVHTKSLDDIFSATVNSDDIKSNEHYFNQLVITGYSSQEQEMLRSLSYESLKAEIQETPLNPVKVFESKRRTVDKLVHELGREDFMKIDVVLADMRQLTDFCRFNFTEMLQVFDHAFNGLDLTYKPAYLPVAPKALEKELIDFYFLASNLRITSSVNNALIALLQMKKGSLSVRMLGDVTSHLKVISSIIKHILTPSIVRNLIALAKSDPSVSPQMAVYKGSARQKFAAYLQESFEANERRLKLEIKDNTTSKELKDLFKEKPLEDLNGYNIETNAELQQNSQVAFVWITAVQIIKSFLIVYLSEPIKTLLNDIVIEGFFNSPGYKTSFSSTVYTCCEALERIQVFEDSFNHGGKNDLAGIKGLIHDSHKDQDFAKDLEKKVNSINTEAKDLVTETTSSLFTLYSNLGDILADARKPNSEIISNLKVLVLSSRNKDNTDVLEKQYSSWTLFFDIMKNYAIINRTDKGN